MNVPQVSIKNPKVLVIDDNPANVRLLEKILQINGISNVMTLTDSRQAMHIYNEYQPDLLLLDLKMPYVDGFEILQSIKEANRPEYLPVIVITAQDDMDNRLKALRLGAQDFIGKPFNNAEVILRVSNFLDIRLHDKDISAKNTELEDAVRDKKQKLHDMQNEMLESLIKAAEFRDQETGNHIVRINKYAYVLAKAMQLTDGEAENIAGAGCMHDIGKIGVPDDILKKPGKLAPSEWDSMKEHTLKGAEILKGGTSDVMQLAQQIALTHHEKWDGTGYPRGLSGTQIPLAGRIIALVDVFDALVSDRPYKKAWKIEDAAEYIKQQSGTSFDPDVVEAFVKCMPDLIVLN